MKILWASNYLSQSAYAIQSRMIVPRLIGLGHQVFVLPLASPHIEIINEINGVPMLNLWDDPLGNDGVVQYWTSRLGIDVIFSLTDTWALDPQVYGKTNALWCPITPIETDGLNQSMIRVLDECGFPIAISQFGLDQLKERYPEAMLWPCSYDPEVWIPGDKLVARRELGFDPLVFLATFVGVNDTLPSRKAIPTMLSAWAQFCEGKDDVLLYLHTAATGFISTRGLGNGVNVYKLFEQLKLQPSQVKITPEAEYRSGVGTAKMVQLAQAADVLLVPSRREGFCVPVIEYQAVGCAAIVSNAHAQKELVGNSYRRVAGQPAWGLGGTFEFVPDVKSIVETLSYSYDNTMFLSQETNKRYQIDHVMTHDVPPILDAVADRILGVEDNE